MMEQQRLLNSGVIMPATPASSSLVYLPSTTMTSGPTAVQQVSAVHPYITHMGGMQQYCLMPLPYEVAPPAAATSDDVSASDGQRNPDGTGLRVTESATDAAAAECKKRELRLQKNKESARLSRLKRKDNENFLVKRVEELDAENNGLRERVQYLEALSGFLCSQGSGGQLDPCRDGNDGP